MRGGVKLDRGANSYRRYLDGDDEGLSEIVHEYSDGLILYLNGIVNNIDLAEELMEETLFKIVTGRPRFVSRHSFKTWLYTIGRNVAIDYLRRQAKHNRIEATLIHEVSQDELDFERIYLLEERRIKLYRALRNLPADYRQVLWLVYLDGMSHTEAGAVMHKNQRQMKNLMYRAKIALKSQLDQEGFVYEEL